MGARTLALTAIVASTLVLPPTICFAESKIGSAITVNNQVEGVTAEGARPLAAGSELYADELVRTVGGESMAQLLFLDNTNLSVGPQAAVRLDKFVYDPNGQAGSVVISASRGAFRFITGLQDPRNYVIKTAYAALGVRGTELYFVKTSNALQVQLIRGVVIVRTISGVVVVLDIPNMVVTVDRNGNASKPVIVNHPLVDFASLGPPVTHYAGLFPSPIDQATGLAVAVVGIGAAVLGVREKPASP